MKTFTEYLNEGRGFELGGKKYSSGFGRYTCDGKSISKEEYMKASAQYKGEKPVSTTNTSKQSQQKQEIPAYQPTEKSAINTAISDKNYDFINDVIPFYVAQNEKRFNNLDKSLNKSVLMKGTVYRKVRDAIQISKDYHKVLQQAKELANKGFEEKEIINKINHVYLNDGIEQAIEDWMKWQKSAEEHYRILKDMSNK